MSLAEDLKRFGAPDESIRWLDQASESNLDYRDLVDGIALARGGQKAVRLSAVLEVDRQPVMYVLSTSMLGTAGGSVYGVISKLRMKLSSRGQGAYLALSEPGRLTIYSIGLSDSLPSPIERTVSDPAAISLFSEITNGLLQLAEDGGATEAFHDKLFRLLTGTSAALLELKELADQHDDVLSLVGRALFARFLIDRGILRELPDGALGMRCFSSPSNAISVCTWMDQVFNGDLLQLAGGQYKRFFERLGPQHEAFKLLTDVVEGTAGGQRTFPFWEEVDFSHVPVGLLSEVYEQLAHAYAGKHAAAESIHYTPRVIAKYMVDEAFEGLPEEQRATARCLDPAVGGGVFLVLCFRRIVHERWIRDCKPPSRRELRNIIENQLRGFDINESALRLAALSLYLSAIELDPAPGKSGDWGFKKMQGHVLLYMRGKHEAHPKSFVLGSLGEMVGEEHKHKYQIVVGNPPWTAWSRRTAHKEVDVLRQASRQIARRIAEERCHIAQGESKQRLAHIASSYKDPDAVPDLPFVWRAMEWADKGAVIALALHARLLFKRTPAAIKARDAVFSALRITGILNGSAVRNEPVWPNVTVPWCLLFAVNDVPTDQHLFYYVSPQLDPSINAQGRLRVDASSAEPVEFTVLREQPSLLKTLFRGTAIDAEILQRVSKVGVPLKKYWKGEQLYSGAGYQTVLTSPDPDNPDDEERAKATKYVLHDASHIHGLPNLTTKTWAGGRILNVRDLKPFTLPKVLYPRDRDLYRSPLVIIPQSMKSDRTEEGAIVATTDVVFSESFYGYSAHGFTKGVPEGLARYLQVLTSSAVFYHYALMASSKFGVERDLVLKQDIDEFPIVPFEKLSAQDHGLLRKLSTEIEDGSADFRELDRWVCSLYGLKGRDVEAVRDALDTAMPFTRSRKLALKKTTADERSVFAKILEEMLNPLLGVIEQKLAATPLRASTRAWKFLQVRRAGDQRVPHQWESKWIEQLAEDEGASVVFVSTGGQLLIGMLDQYRYWTKTRARSCAHHIALRHVDDILGAKVT
jgi:hypothetical protein